MNIIFTFSGIFLNTLVIVSFWKSTQLRKKSCHFMIVVLSCFDLVAVVTIYPGILLYLITWLREDYYFLSATTVYLLSSSVFLPFSFCVLLVMSIERYLGAYYPFFHRTSVTRGRLLTLLAILLISTVVTYLISANGLVIPGRVFLMILLALLLPPFMFVNFKLFTIARKVKREQAVSPVPGERPTLNLKNISTGCGLLPVLCYCTSHSVSTLPRILLRNPHTLIFSYVWAFTCATMNGTLNSLIFF